MVRAFIRFVLSLVAALVALALTVGIVLYVKHSWQRDLIVEVLEGQTRWEWTMETARFASPRHFEAEGVFGLKGAEGFEVGSVDLRVAPSDLLFSQRLLITSGRIEGLFLDLSTMPAEVLGISIRSFRWAMPSREDTLKAVRDLVYLALLRIEATGIRGEINQLEAVGSILLPSERRLEFDLVIEHAQIGRPDDLTLLVKAAEFR